MTLSQGFWTLRLANTYKNKTQHQSTSVLSNQTWPIIPNALMLVHEQKNEIGVNQVMCSTHQSHSSTVQYVSAIHMQNGNTTHVFIQFILTHEKEKQMIESWDFSHNGMFLPLKMLISNSLKCSYLHYKHRSQTLRQKVWRSRRETQSFCYLSTRDALQSEAVCQELQWYLLKKK